MGAGAERGGDWPVSTRPSPAGHPEGARPLVGAQMPSSGGTWESRLTS
jgi:hypothetical protein